MNDLIEQLQTLRDWLRFAVSRFNEAGLHFGHGCDNAYDEAAWLLLHTLHLPRDRLEPFLDAKLTRAERMAVHHVLQLRIAKRMPTAYLTHEAWLGECRFYVDERVIVPRSYFGELLANDFAPWLESPESVRTALDLCTGSGCLAIMMALVFHEARIDAVDLSANALAVARRNVADYALDDRVRLVESDLFDALGKQRYDLIVSNPPYVTAAAMAALPPEYRHEPALALAAGADGLDIVRRILQHARNRLAAHGLLAVEVGHNRDLVEAAFPELPMTWVDCAGGEGKIFILQKDQWPG
ncbi:MAG: 50S ribosomal protein L3 N(5)-glutamine methyltransferase [Betaproteobacteria bacterium]|nr:50S ribosomal protein L3 N(5)-glutamine methyltransferase [Betaproteobacteria bacterium]